MARQLSAKGKMADGEYRRAVICRISKADFISSCGSDLPFVEGIVSVTNDDSIFNEKAEKRFALELKTDLQNLTPEKDFILNACACNETDINTPQSDGNLKVFVLKHVLESHQLHVNDIVWIRKVKPFPLERIVIGISPEESYSWVKKSLGEFLRDCLSKGPITVREGGVLCLPNDRFESGNKEEQWFQLSILQCDPVLQGYVTSETCLVISKLNEPAISLNTEISRMDPSVIPSNSNEIFLVSDFACNLSGSQIHVGSSELSCGSVKWSHQLQVNILDYYKEKQTELTCDASSMLHVSLETLIDLQMFNGSWVKICTRQIPDTLCEDKHEEGSLEVALNTYKVRHHCDKCHIVQIVVTASKNEENDFLNDDEIFIAHTNSKIEDGVAYIAPLLYFNLFHKSSLTDNQRPNIYIHVISDETRNEADTSTASKSRKPPFATEAHVALVHSPHYKAVDSFDHALARHFKTPRMLTVGDIFYVCHNWEENGDVRKELSSSDDQGQRNLVVYFQVTRLVCGNGEGKSCLVDMEHSSLYQVSGHWLFQQSLLPSTCTLYSVYTTVHFAWFIRPSKLITCNSK